MILNLLLLVLSFILLWVGSNHLVESASRVAERFGVSDLVIGLTIVAFGTSAPEFAVTISAAYKGYLSISVGNIVGSNIFNLGFILGSVAIIKSIQTSPKLWFRAYCRWARLRHVFGFPVSPQRMKHVAGRGIRKEIVAVTPNQPREMSL